MFKSWKSLLTIATLTVSFVFFSCSQDVNSKPNFKFMPPTSKGDAFKIGNEVISKAELYKGIESELYQAEMKVYEIKFNKLKSMAMEKLMEQDPRKKGLTNDEYLDQHIAKKVNVTDADVNEFIKSKNIPKQHINPQVKTRVKEFLKIEKKKDAVEDWLANKTKKDPIIVYLQKPERPKFNVIVGDAPIMGSDKAAVTIIEYSDFQCPFCKKASETIGQLKKKYGSKVRVAFKHFPLPFHNFANKAAEASLCAHEQNKDKFWKLHDWMFANQSKLAVGELKKAAKSSGLDSKKFDNCLDSGKYEAKIEADIKEGKQVGVKSTPTFFVNGKLISGAQPMDVFEEVIAEELGK